MLNEQAAAHALAIVAALAKRAGGKVRIEFAELGDEGYQDIAIAADENGITAELVEFATPEESRAAVEQLASMERKLESLALGAAIARGPMKFRD